MRVFVTGASGFVGGHVVERLLRDGHTASAMARSERSAKTVEALGAAAVRCDLTDVSASHLAGHDAVVHCAAYAEEWGSRDDFWSANVEGTDRVLSAARSAGVGRFVFIGTEAAFFTGDDLVDIDETLPYPEQQKYLYSETKAEAERRVLHANAEGFTALSLRPRLVWGPRDATVLPVIVRMAREGRFAWLDQGRSRTSTCHVTNLAAAVSLALTRGRGGEAYFIADDGERTLREFLSALAETQGVSLGERSVPGAIARPATAALEAVWRAMSIERKPPATAFATAMMSRAVTVKTDKARRELGYAPEVSVDEGLAAMRAG